MTEIEIFNSETGKVIEVKSVNLKDWPRDLGSLGAPLQHAGL